MWPLRGQPSSRWGGCAPGESLRLVPLQRLLDEPDSWTLESTVSREWSPRSLDHHGRVRAGFVLEPGESLERAITLPPQPCWLRFEIATAPESSSDVYAVSVEDSAGELDLLRAALGPSVPLADPDLRAEQIDLEPFAGRSVRLRFTVATDAAQPVTFSHPRLETQEVFDLRYRTCVVALVSQPVLRTLLDGPAEDRDGVRIEGWTSRQSPAAEQREFLHTLGTEFRAAGAECLAFHPGTPPAPESAPVFDDWFGLDPWSPREHSAVGRAALDASEFSPEQRRRVLARGELALLQSLGRFRPQSALIAIGSELADAVALRSALTRVRDQLEREGLWKRCLFVVTAPPTELGGTTTALVRTPRRDFGDVASFEVSDSWLDLPALLREENFGADGSERLLDLESSAR